MLLMQCAVYGNFSGPKAQEIILSRGKVLELLRPDDTGRLQTILSTEVRLSPLPLSHPCSAEAPLHELADLARFRVSCMDGKGLHQA